MTLDEQSELGLGSDQNDSGCAEHFFTQSNKLFSAKVIGIEGGDPKGLAALLVGGPLPPGLLPLFID